ncbi:MAG TPA: oxidoreductase [Saprospiraceae bacterium]|nr:oxidoreductase [Saprospiraceae bacterium]HMQ85029.1 oxidoreductase [Saprospiraceae bacterium]
MAKDKKTALLLGATGLIGSQLLPLLLNEARYEKVIALVRRPLPIQHPKLQNVLFDYEQPDPSIVKGDEVFCCLGTTLKKAGSKAAQYRVDHDYPLEIGRLALANGVQTYLLVSSIGATTNTSNFYLRTKGELEKDLENLGFNRLVILRPSVLLGDRSEFRLGEKIGIGLVSVLSPLLLGSLKKYRGIHAKTVAEAMIREARVSEPEILILESDKIGNTPVQRARG